jgi:hypothetical protein
MAVNQKKSGIMVIKKNKNKKVNFTSLLEFPVVESYKYLGIMLDTSFTLKILDERLKGKTDDFCKNITKFCPKSFPISLRILLWKTYLKSIFDYNLLSFGVFKNKTTLIEKQFFKSLKAACSLPKQIGHLNLLGVLRIWSPRRTCIYYFHRVARKIKERMSLETIPRELQLIWEELVGSDLVFLTMTKEQIRDEIDRLEFGEKGEGDLDIMKYAKEFDYRVLRASLGVLFSLKHHLNFKPEADFQCKICHCEGTQEHFLGECSLWDEKKKMLRGKHNELLSAMNVTNLHQLLTNIRAIKCNWGNVVNLSNLKQKIRDLMTDVEEFIIFAFDEFVALYPNKGRR